MNNTHNIIIKIVINYLKKKPEQRFGQALFNLGINEFEDLEDANTNTNRIRDIYNDSDKAILERMQKSVTN